MDEEVQEEGRVDSVSLSDVSSRHASRVGGDEYIDYDDGNGMGVNESGSSSSDTEGSEDVDTVLMYDEFFCEPTSSEGVRQSSDGTLSDDLLIAIHAADLEEQNEQAIMMTLYEDDLYAESFLTEAKTASPPPVDMSFLQSTYQVEPTLAIDALTTRTWTSEVVFGQAAIVITFCENEAQSSLPHLVDPTFTAELSGLCSRSHTHILKTLAWRDRGGETTLNRFHIQSFRKIAVESFVSTLEHYIQENNQTLDLFDRLLLARDAICAVHSLHHHTPFVLHRNLTPSNFFITRDGILKLGGFSMSHVALKQQGESSMAEASVDTISTNITDNQACVTHISGTTTYMAPEVLSEGALATSYSSGSDIFALALVIYFIFTGQHPYSFHSNHLCMDELRSLICRLDLKQISLLLAAEPLKSMSVSASPVPIHIVSSLTRSIERIQSLLQQCWVREPAKRMNAKQLLDAWDDIILLPLSTSPILAKIMWNDYIRDCVDVRHAVPLKVIIKQAEAVLTESVCVASTRLEILSGLEIALENGKNRGYVSLPMFENFVGLYLAAGDHTFDWLLLSFHRWIKTPYFFGPITRERQREVNEAMESRTYLVRYSNCPTEASRITLVLCYDSTNLVFLPIFQTLLTDGTSGWKIRNIGLDSDSEASTLEEAIAKSAPAGFLPTRLQSPFSHIFRPKCNAPSKDVYY